MSKLAKDLIDAMTEAAAYADGKKASPAVHVTKSFNELVQTRAARDPDFAAALLHESVGAAGKAKGDD